MTPPEPVTQLLVAWGNGDETARDELMPLVYRELHRLAHYYMKRENPGHTLQTRRGRHGALRTAVFQGLHRTLIGTGARCSYRLS